MFLTFLYFPLRKSLITQFQLSNRIKYNPCGHLQRSSFTSSGGASSKKPKNLRPHSSGLKMKLSSESSITPPRPPPLNLSPRTVIVLAGATSVGKSAVAMELCRIIPSEVVIADSVQVYRRLDIGSNKPTQEEQEMVPHHLIDIADPREEPLNSASFCSFALQAINDILSRGKTPIIVGGSTMWIQWLVHGMPDAPEPSKEAIEKANALLDDLEKEKKWEEGIDILSKYDPKRAEKIVTEKNNWYRLRRALTIALDLSLKPVKDKADSDGTESKRMDSPTTVSLTGERRPILPSSDYDLRCFFLVEDRVELYDIIDERCEQMLRAGLIEETANLILTNYFLPVDSPMIKSIGYRQAIKYLVSTPPPLDYAAFLDFLQDFATATRNYAKQQINWYRRDKEFLFTKIFREKQKKETFQRSYKVVMQELLTLLSFSKEEHQKLLEDQLLKAKYHLQYSQKGSLRKGHVCQDETEYRVLLHLIKTIKVKLKPTNELTPISGPLTIDAIAVDSFQEEENHSLTALGNLVFLLIFFYFDYFVLDFTIRYAENSHTKFFASRFQGKPDLTPFNSIIQRSDELRTMLWKTKTKEMEEFRNLFSKTKDN